MTKDAERLLYCLYGIFKEKNKTESRALAKEMTEAEIADKCNSYFNSEDVSDLLTELSDNEYIKIDVIGDIELQNSAIKAIENQPKETFEKIVDFIAKLK